MPQQQSLARFFASNNKTKRSEDGKNESNNTKRASGDGPGITKTELNEHLAKKAKHDIAQSESWKLEKEPEAFERQDIDDATELIRLAKEQRKEHAGENLSSKIHYSELTSVFDAIEAESSRLKITALVSQFFLQILRSSTPDKLVKVVYLFINRLGPDYEPDLELGLGETLLIKAISECYGRPASKIKKDYQEVGDLGVVAQKSRSGQPTMFKPPRLDVDTVFENLTKIAKSTGKDSQSRKISTINRMLTACDMKTSEAKFLIRSLEGKLRIGLAEKTVLISLAQAFVDFEAKNQKVSPERLTKAEDTIREAYSQIPNYEIIVKSAYKFGIFNLLDHCALTPGIPLKPMLAKPTRSISEILDRFQGHEFTCEYKYDGERAQVHVLSDGRVKVYSRNSEDMSQRYPDLVSIMKEFLSKEGSAIKSVILDCEAVAWDRNTDKILPFQILSTRKRKDVEEKDIKVHICLFAFDILYYNGAPLISKSLAERREILFSNLVPVEGKFQFATHKNTSDVDEMQAFLNESVQNSCEGLMVKMLHGPSSQYEPSKRSINWLKLKKDYLSGVGDSLDLVVIGAYLGKGKRTGSYGGFLLATYNSDTGEYETTCKIGTGFSDDDLASLYSLLKPTEIDVPKSYYVYDRENSNAVPDVWFEPTTVFEVLTADLSLSPIYKSGHQLYGKGISLRFPRYIRIRDDKSTEDATSSSQITELYERQSHIS